MGRRPPAELVPVKEAAALLRVDSKTVLAWARKGLLETSWQNKRMHFRKDDVEGLARVLPRGDLTDLGTLGARADLAYAKSCTVERQMNEFLDLFGLNQNALDVHPYAVEILQQDISSTLLDVNQPSVEEVRYWAGIFFAVDEAYLHLVEKCLATHEPWKKMMDLGHKLTAEAPYDRFDDEPGYRPAYGYLRSARAQLRAAAYFYCREERGVELADRLFGTAGKVTERLLGLLYPGP